MTVQIITGPVVEAPTPAPRRGGLLDVADVRGGIAWLDPETGFLSWNCMTGGTAELCDDTDPLPEKVYNAPEGVEGARFVVYMAAECKPLNMMGEIRDNLSRVFDLRESYMAEQQFQATILDAATAASASANAAVAVGTLEAAMAADYAGLPVLHMGLVAAYQLAEDQLIEESGGKFYTRLGTPVVVGAGYTANAMWATGQPVLFEGEKNIVEVPDTTNNTAKVLVERMYVAYADCAAYKTTIGA